MKRSRVLALCLAAAFTLGATISATAQAKKVEHGPFKIRFGEPKKGKPGPGIELFTTGPGPGFVCREAKARAKSRTPDVER